METTGIAIGGHLSIDEEVNLALGPCHCSRWPSEGTHTTMMDTIYQQNETNETIHLQFPFLPLALRLPLAHQHPQPSSHPSSLVGQSFSTKAIRSQSLQPASSSHLKLCYLLLQAALLELRLPDHGYEMCLVQVIYVLFCQQTAVDCTHSRTT